jgi:hypothetical protein
MTDRALVVIDHGYLTKALEADFAKAKIDYLVFSDELCSDLGFSRDATWLYPNFDTWHALNRPHFH